MAAENIDEKLAALDQEAADRKAASAPKPDKRAQALAAVSELQLDSLQLIGTKQIVPKIPIILGLLYAGAYLLTGRPKIGKSWLLLQLVLALGEGGMFLGFDCGKDDCEVLAVFAEDDDARIQSRLAALGVAKAPANVHVVNMDSLVRLAQQFRSALTFEQFLDAWLETHPKAKAVIVDTETTCRQLWNGAQSRRDNRRITEADYEQTRAFDSIALRRRVLILLVNHASKRKGGRGSEGGDVHESINRSGTAVAGASGSISISDRPGSDPLLDSADKRRVFAVRARDLKDDVVLAIRQQPDMPHFVSEGPYVEVKQTEVEIEILEVIEEDFGVGKFVTSSEIARALGKNRSTVKTSIRRMLRVGNRTTWKSYRITAKRGPSGGIKLEPIGASEETVK